jgi:hypothetical protein
MIKVLIVIVFNLFYYTIATFIAFALTFIIDINVYMLGLYLLIGFKVVQGFKSDYEKVSLYVK